MANSICSLASPTSCASSTSSSSSSSSTSSSPSIVSSRSSSSDKALSLKSSSSIDRRKRLAANARERKRMHLLNKAYDELRRRLVDAENKSKYDVLVQAKEYIQALATICEKFDLQDQQHQATIVVGSQQSRAPTVLPSSPDIKHQITPVDMTYNPYLQTHFNSNNHRVVSVHHKTPIQLYQQQQQNDPQNVSFT